MTAIKDGHVVKMDYTLTNDQGQVVDTSQGQEPLAYLQGKNNIIPGLEKEMAGKKEGDSFKVTVSPEEGYGIRHDEMIQSIPKDQFGPDAENIQVGMQFQIEAQNGEVLMVTAIEIKDDVIVLDANHPLAGQTLHFEVTVVCLRDATEKELAAGYPLPEDAECDKDGCC